jgi:hypothetical protein
MAGVVAYVVRLYFTYFYAEQFTRYPTPIAKSLRRAIYYSNYRPDPKLALKYWRLALEQCDQHHLDPFSDDVTGIKIQLAAWLEKIGNYDGAIKVLETLLSDCKRWVELMETSVKEGKVAQNEATLLPPSNLLPDTREGKANTKPETLWGKRTRLLGKCVGISVKLGELYADEHVLKEEKAHERLTWAVETALGEFRRRTVEGLKEGEGQWMNAEAIGGALECRNPLPPFRDIVPYENLAANNMGSSRPQLRTEGPVPSGLASLFPGSSVMPGPMSHGCLE